MADLTPVERSVLVALMAEGGPLKEAADLGARYGIRMTGWHRKRLADMGLVKTTKAPFTHELTDKGWAFLASDFPMDVPQVSMKLGAMNALLAGVRQQVGADGAALKGFFTGKGGGTPAAAPPAPPPPPEAKAPERDLMAEAAWSESETQLAMALQAMPAFDGRFGALEKALDGQGEAALKQVSLAAENVFQNLRMAARKRGLDALHKRNETVAFDPVYFDATDDMDEGEDALVMKQPIIRTRDGEDLVILRGLAAPLD